MLQMGVGSGPDGFYIVCVCPYLSNAPVCGRTFPELVSEGGGEGTSRGCPSPREHCDLRAQPGSQP